MDCNEYITNEEKHKKYQHLTFDIRGGIQALHEQGYSNRHIAKVYNCSPSTIHNELLRGTPVRKGSRGRMPKYSAKYGQKEYEEHRKNSHRNTRFAECIGFIDWVIDQVKQKKWAFDSCCGFAKLNKLFPAKETVCTKTLYNWLWSHTLPLSVFDLPEAVSRRKRTHPKLHCRRRRGKSIEERPAIPKGEFGHWEGDTVVGKKKGKGPVVFTLVEKQSNYYRSIKIPGRNAQAVNMAMQALKAEFGEKFPTVFKTITVDNGPEFEYLSEFEKYGVGIYYAHPYCSSDRAQNENGNRLFRRYVPKGKPIEKYSEEEILLFSDDLNEKPRKRLEYETPDGLFETFLDSVYRMK